MSIDFFNSPCRESARKEKLFGICDDQDGKKAYTNTSDPESWIARVINNPSHEIAFTAIDHCTTVYTEGTNELESTCDGMLTFEDSLYLVELKNDRTGGWIPDATRQLENTIKLLQRHHNLAEYKYLKAFVCNRKHPRFKTIENSTNKAFFDRTKFRLDVQANIAIKK